MSEFKTNTRKAVFGELDGYCPFAKENGNDYIEVTKWTNYEGFDVTVNDVQGEVNFKLTNGEFKLLKKLVKQLNRE